jgi:predicted HicB family RNase H-like nuclease
MRQAIAESVDDYLPFCAERGEESDRPICGKVGLSIDPEFHHTISLKACSANKCLSSWVTETQKGQLSGNPKHRAVTVSKLSTRPLAS